MINSGIELIVKVRHAWSKIIAHLFFAPFCFHFGKSSTIVSPISISKASKIKIGSYSLINDNAFIVTSNKKEKSYYLDIGDHVILGHRNHLVAYNYLKIENWVLTADNVFITDCYHGYESIEQPITKQEVYSKGETLIGEGTFIGENSSIISCKIGKHCVIGANSVVLKDIPDYCVVVGNPAKIVKRYDFETKGWKKVITDE